MFFQLSKIVWPVVALLIEHGFWLKLLDDVWQIECHIVTFWPRLRYEGLTYSSMYRGVSVGSEEDSYKLHAALVPQGTERFVLGFLIWKTDTIG